MKTERDPQLQARVARVEGFRESIDRQRKQVDLFKGAVSRLWMGPGLPAWE
jgi:hypothetical protein